MKEGASVENDDRTLETISEDDTSIPEVTGDAKDKGEQPDDDAIIASFNPHQEAFLDRLLKRPAMPWLTNNYRHWKNNKTKFMI